MRIIHLMNYGEYAFSIGDIHQAVARFYHQFKVHPSHIKMQTQDMADFFKSFNPNPIMVLERGKQYANYVQTITGPVMLDVLDDEDLGVGFSTSAHTQMQKYFVVENTEIDKAFETHIINEGQ